MTISAPRWRRSRPRVGPQAEVALINLMGDTAFIEAERQFASLVHTAAGNLEVHLSRFSIPVGERRPDVAMFIEERYSPLEDLTEWAPDAVVVTGTEPKTDDLSCEAFWGDLAAIYRWAEATGCAVLSSCLASHASLLALDGMPRRRLPAKLSGLFPQQVRRGHPLTEGVRPLRCPHSRHNEVPRAELERAGYEILVSSPEVGWTVAVRDAGCLSVLVQGHPEYEPDTLLREYRRDARRYLEGERDEYPEIPVGYLAADAVRLLEAFRASATAERDPGYMAVFPFEACASQVRAHPKGPMERLVGNWLQEVARRAGRGVRQAREAAD